jgi:hypothetical protein
MRASVGLAIAWAACGGSAHRTQDASPPDAATDTLASPTGDAPAGAVTIAVTVGGQQAAHVAVFFQNPDSSVVLAAATDHHGTVGALMPGGGFVTAIEPDDATGVIKLVTFAGVAPGDALHLDLAPVDQASPVLFDLTVPSLSGATGYQVYTQCGSVIVPADTATTIQLAGCGANADMLVAAVDDQSRVVGSFFHPAVAISSASVVLTDAYDAPTATNFSYTGVPGLATWVKTTQVLYSAHGRLFDNTTGSVPGVGIASESLAQPSPTTLQADTVTDIQPASNEHGEQLVYDFGGWTGSYALDLGPWLLPEYASDAGFDVGSHTITWSESETGAQADFVRATVHVYRDAIPQGTTWAWSIIAPRATATSVALPQLPKEQFDFNPKSGDTITVSDLTNARVPGGYDAFRANGFTPITSLAATGKLVLEIPYAPPL